MKRNIYTLVYSTLFICLFGMLSPGSAHAQQPTCINNPKRTLSGEKKLHLKKFFKKEKEAENLDVQFKNYFKLQSGTIDITPEVIKMSALVALYDTANGRVNCPYFATGLRISLGLEQNKMVYFYQPLYMCSKKIKRKFRVNKTFISPYYQYDAVTKTFYVSDTGNYLKNYRDNILIDHFKQNNFVPFIYKSPGDANSTEGDTQSIIFSFQELFKLYNRSYTETDSERYCKEVLIVNGGANYRKTGTHVKYRLKHTLYIKTAVSQGILHAANLAHLCPPSCNLLKY